jgi:cation diffusion facilitator family transporter
MVACRGPYDRGLELGVALISGSAALLADMIHHLDALAIVPLWIAFKADQWSPNDRFTYGYGRVEDLAGFIIVMVIGLSAATVAYESLTRLVSPHEESYLFAVAIAALISFIGNQFVFSFRSKIGKEIGSVALVAEGNHARIDSLASLAVLIGVIGVSAGYPFVDPLIGLIIVVLVLRVAWMAGVAVTSRFLDSIDPKIVREIEDVARDVSGVAAVRIARARWLGHQVNAEVTIAVDRPLESQEGHAITENVRKALLDNLNYVSDVVIVCEPE